MSWQQFTPGENPDAAKYNAIGTWTSYTPAVTGMTLGNGTAVGKWTRIGNTVSFWADITIGSTSSVTGPVTVSLPVSATTPPHRGQVGAEMFDTSAATSFPLLTGCTSTVAVLYAINAAGTYAVRVATSGAIPVAPATGDVYHVSGTYEVD